MKLDRLSLLGFVIALGGVLGGFYANNVQIIKGLVPESFRPLINEPAFAIVLCGSFGVLLIGTPRRDLRLSLRSFGKAIQLPPEGLGKLREQILKLASLARREGMLALDEYATSKDADPFLAKCLNQAIDGSSAEDLRLAVETDMELRSGDMEVASRFWEQWATLCPTFGIFGSVLGLVTVLPNLQTSPEDVGNGIATAFIATVYGIGMSNILCLPISYRLNRLSEQDDIRMSMVLEGVLGIQAGMAPGALRSRLEVYLTPEERVVEAAAT